MSSRPLRLSRDPTTDAVAALLTAWRSTAATLKRYGSASQAELVERLADELAAALRGAGVTERAAPVRERASEPEDRLLTVAQAAERLGVSIGWVHRHWRSELRACARPLGQRVLRFSAQALDQHLRGDDHDAGD